MNKKSRKIILFLFAVFLAGFAFGVEAHMPRLIYKQAGEIKISNPEISQAFYDALAGQPRIYILESEKDFVLYLNLLVPEAANPNSRYSANIFSTGNDGKKLLYSISASIWQEFYEPFGRDYYLKGPELERNLAAGRYRIEVFSSDNLGKYVLAIGKKEVFPLPEALNIYWQLPLLKTEFFKTSVLEFIFTPFGIAGIGAIFGALIFVAILNFFGALILRKIKEGGAKAILLTSAGMQMKEEIIKLLQKPAYDVNVAFVTTAYKYKSEENPDYVNKDLIIMREMGFNIEEVDIEGKNKNQLIKILGSKDIIFVEGGNAFYLMKAIRQSGFKKVVSKLLKQGKVYIGASAGSIVAGKNIKTAEWLSDEYEQVKMGVKNFKGMGLVPFDIFVHYTPEHAEIIRKKLPWKRQRKKLKILTNEQAILIQGRERVLIGKGEAIIV